MQQRTIPRRIEIHKANAQYGKPLNSAYDAMIGYMEFYSSNAEVSNAACPHLEQRLVVCRVLARGLMSEII